MRKAIAAALTATFLTALAPPATAGTYTVHTCQTPTGVPTSADGWSPTWSAPAQGHDPGDTTRCSAGALGLQFGATQLSVIPGHQLMWSFAAPQDTAIKWFRAGRTFEIGWIVDAGYDRPFVYDAWYDDDEGDIVEVFEAPWNSGASEEDASGPTLAAGPGRWDAISFRLYCSDSIGAGLCGPYRARLTLTNIAVTLEDVIAPEASANYSALRGDSGAVRGVGGLAFSATDTGGGVYRAILSIDGEEVGREVVDSNGGRCGDVEAGNGDPYEFGTPQPCPLMVDGQMTFDTRVLRDGTHAVRLELEDAAGNVSLVHQGEFRTHNAPVATSAPGLAGDARVGGALAVDPGEWDGAPTALDHRWLRCDGNGANCAPIAGADDATYAPTATDAYHRLIAEVTAHNDAGTATARTAVSPLVADEDGHTSPQPGPGPGDGDGRTPPPGDRDRDPPADDDPRPQDDRPGGADPDRPGGPAASGAPQAGGHGVDGLRNPVADAGGHTGNGTNASPRARIAIGLRRAAGAPARRRVRIPYGRRAIVAGRLLDEHGKPIQAARLNVAVRVAGRRWTSRATTRTGQDGRLSIALPPGPSRSVRLTYFAFADSRRFVSSATVSLDVASPVTIRVNRRSVTGDRVVTVSGTAAGRPAPAGGVLVTLQGFQAGYGWRTFRTVRADRAGRWSTRYRFRSTTGRFAFRAIVPEQGGHPFATGRSRAVHVTVG